MKAAIVARLKWNWYRRHLYLEDGKVNTQSGLTMVPEKFFFKEGEPAQMPDVYFLYLDCKNWRTLWWPGTVADQPHLLMNEFSMCRAAEIDFDHNVLPPMQEQHEVLMKAEEQRKLQQQLQQMRGY